jgi:hypothetical protein
MSDMHVRIAARGTLDEAFSEMPPAVKAFLSEGFLLFSKLTKENMSNLLPAVLDSVQSGSGRGDQELASRLRVDRDDARLLLGSMSLIASMLSRREESPSQFIKAMAEAKILRPEASGAALAFFDALVRERPALRQAMTRSRFSSEVLPSLLEFESTVDLRLGFENDAINVAIPIALVHLDTNATGQEVWLQITRKQLEEMIKDLEETLRKMVEAEKWAGQRSQAKE